jgi:hypothetical protein
MFVQRLQIILRKRVCQPSDPIPGKRAYRRCDQRALRLPFLPPVYPIHCARRPGVAISPQRVIPHPVFLIDGEQLFIESADLSSAIDKVNFENPVTRLSIGSEVTHAAWILRMDVKSNLVARNFLVRELPQ